MKKIKCRKILIPLIVVLVVIIIVIIRFDIIKKIDLYINPILISNIEINIENTELELNQEENVNIKITPNDYTKSNIVWYSTNNKVIEIQDGKIIAKNLGRSTIYVVDENNVKSNEIQVECLVKITDIEIENQIESMKLGDIYKLDVKIYPENATYKQIQFESSSPDIVTVDNTGNLIANSLGNSEIVIKNLNGNILKSFNLAVNKIPVEKLELDDYNIKLGKGQEYIINSRVEPIDATYTDVTWESSDKSIVTIENRKIKAVNQGKATIKAITDNGDKTAECTIIVEKVAPNNEKKFANGNYNIRTGASTDYKVLDTTSKLEEIEFLQDSKEGWKKVRNSKGIVGYTQVKSNYYLKEKPVQEPTVTETQDSNENIVTSYHIKNVPYINQFNLGYPTGCEAVSATMLLRYKGYKVVSKDIIDNTKCGSKKHQKSDGKWYGANPFEEFVGHPSNGLGKGSYGVFAKPIATAMNKFANGKAKNISGCSEKDLFNYVSKGNPVVVWCVKNAGNLKEGVTWNYEDGTGNFQELVGEHCAVLIGYDENYVYLNDPSAGENVKQSKSKFISNWKRLFSQAIIVE